MSFNYKHASILNNNAQFHIWEIKEFNQNELYLGSFIDRLFVINTEVWPPVVKHHIDSGNSETSISMEKVTFQVKQFLILKTRVNLIFYAMIYLVQNRVLTVACGSPVILD